MILGWISEERREVVKGWAEQRGEVCVLRELALDPVTLLNRFGLPQCHCEVGALFNSHKLQVRKFNHRRVTWPENFPVPTRHKISTRESEYSRRNPHARLIQLGIGDTTQPIPDIITSAMAEQALALSTTQGYKGYGPEQGNRVKCHCSFLELRRAIAETLYQGMEVKEK
ncbi:hypothetical protein V8G54_023312 [Vigna mungo]|uniref:Aminotransferase class I/classII domain-containing protein n=1 Tax=Vigna mungo TaxID=3915 RepID=A0AAQ3RSF0_VIGMU